MKLQLLYLLDVLIHIGKVKKYFYAKHTADKLALSYLSNTETMNIALFLYEGVGSCSSLSSAVSHSFSLSVGDFLRLSSPALCSSLSRAVSHSSCLTFCGWAWHVIHSFEPCPQHSCDLSFLCLILLPTHKSACSSACNQAFRFLKCPRKTREM